MEGVSNTLIQNVSCSNLIQLIEVQVAQNLSESKMRLCQEQAASCRLHDAGVPTRVTLFDEDYVVVRRGRERPIALADRKNHAHLSSVYNSLLPIHIEYNIHTCAQLAIHLPFCCRSFPTVLLPPRLQLP